MSGIYADPPSLTFAGPIYMISSGQLFCISSAPKSEMYACHMSRTHAGPKYGISAGPIYIQVHAAYTR